MSVALADRHLLMIMVLAMVLLFPSAALAGPPTVVADFRKSFTDDVPAEFSPCDFGFHVEGTVSVRITEFYEKDGMLDRVTFHVRGTTIISTERGETWDRWTLHEVFDPEQLTATQVGNLWNVHSGAGGVLVKDSGRIVIDATTGEAIVINGPHQAWEDDFGAFCEALAT